MATKNEKIESAQSDSKKYMALEAMSKSEGGQVLLASVQADIDSAINEIIAGYTDLEDIQLRALCAKLAVNYNLMNVLLNAPANKQFAIDELKNLGVTAEETP